MANLTGNLVLTTDLQHRREGISGIWSHRLPHEAAATPGHSISSLPGWPALRPAQGGSRGKNRNSLGTGSEDLVLAFAVSRTSDQTPVFSSLGLRVFRCRGLTRDTPLKLDPLPCTLREHGIRKACPSSSFTCCLENTVTLPSYSQHPPLAVHTSGLCMWHCPRQLESWVLQSLSRFKVAMPSFGVPGNTHTCSCIHVHHMHVMTVMPTDTHTHTPI